MSDLCLAVDLGTGGPKVALVTLDGEVTAVEIHAVTTHLDPSGAATQDPEEWWTLIGAASRRLVAAVDTSRVVAIGVTGQYASTVPVDEQGAPVGECLTWLDTRGVTHARSVLGGPVMGYAPLKVAAFVRRSAGAPSVTAGDPLGQILFLERERPEVAARARWYAEPIDYLTGRMTGVVTGSPASRLALWLTDNRDLATVGYDPRLVRLSGLPGEKLPPLVATGSLVGGLNARAADTLGLREGTPVVAAVPDLHAAALGAGAVGPYQAHAALSTTAWVSCPVPRKKTDVAHSIATVPGLGDGRYLVIDNQETGARALEWCRDLLWPGATYEELTALAARAPAGAHGVRVGPGLAGERSPVQDKELRAVVTGLGVATSRADVVRAVMEGVASNVAWLFGHVERFTGHRLDPVSLVGGGAESTLWCQMVADATGRCVVRTPNPRAAPLRGVAHLCALALGSTTLDELAARTRVGERFEPAAQPAGSDLAALYRLERAWRRTRRGAPTGLG
ncbi:MAG TPA: FGGY family carbohydrate kinase [Acidimicrobiales bacterium]|nr:FGGY family carbohydrate kinase [Acidimicrobiales bacterium]